MTANRMKPVFRAGLVLAALATAVLASSAWAGDRYDQRTYGAWFVYKSDPPPPAVSKSGIFSGTFGLVRTAYGSFQTLSTYLAEPLASPVPAGNVTYISPSVKIIDVAREMDGNVFASRACSYESGVCVIRGGR